MGGVVLVFCLVGGFWGLLGGGFLGFGKRVLGFVGGVIQYLVSLGYIFWGLVPVVELIAGMVLGAYWQDADVAEVLGSGSGFGTTCRKQLRARGLVASAKGWKIQRLDSRVGRGKQRLPVNTR